MRPVTVRGDFIDLFDPNLTERKSITIHPGTRAFLLDVHYFHSTMPRILAASAKISNEQASKDSLSFEAEGIDQTQSIVQILCPKALREVTLQHKALDPSQFHYAGRSLGVHFVTPLPRRRYKCCSSCATLGLWAAAVRPIGSRAEPWRDSSASLQCQFPARRRGDEPLVIAIGCG